jgi:uncharacterized membrane protein (UPF0127 family)
VSGGVVELRREDGEVMGRLDVAGSFWARLRGLIGRPAPETGGGLLLPGANSIHMLFMRYPIDCLFLGDEESDGARRVVDLRHSLPPWRGIVWWVRGARAAAELPAGTLAAARLTVGDRVRLAPA